MAKQTTSAKPEPAAKPAAPHPIPAVNRVFCRKAADRMSRNTPLKRSIVGAGYTINDLQEEVRIAILEVEMLNTPLEGKEDCCYGAWICDIICPGADSASPWTAVVYASDQKIYAVNFTIAAGGAVTLDGDPKEVERKTDYDFVKEITGQPESAPAVSPRKWTKTGILKRFARISEADIAEDGSIQVCFASEYPVRTRASQVHVDLGAASKRGERFYEVLSHRNGDANLTALNNTGAFYDDHDDSKQIGHVAKAAVSDDLRSRAALVPDLITELSRTRAEQMRKRTRPHVSVGYVPTQYLGEEDIGDGTIVKRFAWDALEISSVGTPADPNASANRSRSQPTTSEAETAHCIHCGDEFARSEMNETYECPDCVADGRSIKDKSTRHRQTIDSRQRQMDPVTITAEQLETSKKDSRKQAATDLLARNAKIAAVVDDYVKDHGMRKRGACGEALRKIGNEFSQRNDETAEPTLLLELGQRCLAEQAKFPAEPYLFRAESNDREYASYSFRRAIKSVIEHRCADGVPKDGLEREVHQDIESRAKENGGLGYKSEGGFHMPMDAPVPYFPKRRGKGEDRLTRYATNGKLVRDIFGGDFTSGGALVPTQLLVPIIELLYNKEVLPWAGTRTLAGLQGNIVIPRQTSPSAPSAVAEIAALLASQPTFDQVRGEPHRVGNTVTYGKELLLQATPNVEAVLHDDNLRMIAIKHDELGLNGQGANSEPLGIYNTPGIGSEALSGTPTLAQIIQMETNIREANIYDPVVYLATSSTRGLLMSSPAQLTGSTIVSGQTNALWVAGPGEDDDTVVGRPALDSQQIPSATILTGAFEIGHMMLMWGGIDIVVDYWTKAANYEIVLTYNTLIDFIVRHPQAFTVGTGASQ